MAPVGRQLSIHSLPPLKNTTSNRSLISKTSSAVLLITPTNSLTNCCLVTGNPSLLNNFLISFRLPKGYLKTTMRTRPIFHWTPRRIKGHFVICFMAFVLERALENKLKSNGIEASPEKIREAINSLEVSKILIRDRPYYLKSRQLPLASRILKTVRIRHLPNLSTREELISYLR